jgi:hypothetical protein
LSTDSLVQEVLKRDGEEARADLLARRLDALVLDTQPGLRAPRAVRSEADAMASDVARGGGERCALNGLNLVRVLERGDGKGVVWAIC